MSSLNDSSLNQTITFARVQVITNRMTLYVPIIILIIGIIGCLFNALTFTSRKLRHNSCAFYFLCSTIFEFFSITFGLISRLAADHWNNNLQNTNRLYCKLRAYFVSSIPLIATYLILLSAIDRCMSSSIRVRLRSFSQIRLAYRSTFVVILIGLISCSHILISYDLRPKCSTLPGLYAIFDGMFVIFWLGIIPHMLMLIFGLLTVINVRRMRQRKIKRKNCQLISMMLIQVSVSSILVLTRMIYYAYYILGPTFTGSNKTIGSFLMSFTTLLYYANYAKSFYIYTLTSRVFRLIFIERINEFLCVHR